MKPITDNATAKPNDRASRVRSLDTLVWNLYNLLLAARENDEIEIQTAGKILGQLLSTSDEAWNVVGITEAALTAFADEGFARRPEGANRVQRAHLVHRRDIYPHIFGPQEKRQNFNSGEEIIDFWKQYDLTVIGLSSENAQIGNGGGELMCYLITHEQHRFFKCLPVSYAFHHSREGAYLQTLKNKVDDRTIQARKVSELRPMLP